MAISFMVNRLKALFLLVLGVIKRALCCFRRRRRASGDPIPLTAVGVVPNNVISIEVRVLCLATRFVGFQVLTALNMNALEVTPCSLVERFKTEVQDCVTVAEIIFRRMHSRVQFFDNESYQVPVFLYQKQSLMWTSKCNHNV
jgi:hypothetical protein